MSNPIVVLPVDLTGKAVGNKIQNEIHSPAAAAVRMVIPRFGAFFADSLVVVDAVTQAPVSKTLYQSVDVWRAATEQTSQTVTTLVLLKVGAPASVALTYQGFGGPQSRNAEELVAWYYRKLANSTGSLDFSELEDFPDRIKPSEHTHLASHLYGFEYITDAFDRLKQGLVQGGADGIEEARSIIIHKVNDLYERTLTTAEGLVQNAFYKWRDEINLFYLGCDQLSDMDVMDFETSVKAVAGSFVVQNPEDDRYVTLSGLGTFCKKLVERLLNADTALGKEFAQAADATKGNLLGAKVGEVWIVPPKATAIKTTEGYEQVYPKDYPLDRQMIIEKSAAHPRGYAGVFTVYNPVNGDSWIGVLVDSGYRNRINWFKRYEAGELIGIEKMLDDHAKAIGPVHHETKLQLGLGNVLNLPVVTIDQILSNQPVNAMHTLATMLYAFRAWMENVDLPIGANGEVDLTANPMLQPKVIFAPCKETDGQADIKILDWFCQGSDKYGKWTNGHGGIDHKLIELNSDDCKFVDLPKQGTSLGKFCDPGTKSMMEKFADGRGGSTSEIVEVNAVSCGYVKPRPYGDIIAEYCVGVNMVREIADGNGKSILVPILINTIKCDGTNSEGGGSSGTGSSSKAKIVMASTHKRIYSGTQEILSVYFTGLVANTQYTAGLWVKSTAAFNGVPTETLSLPFRTGPTGTYTKELTLIDNGVTPRGVYDSYAILVSENLESNHLTREFLGGTAPAGQTDPNSDTGTTRPDGGTVGTGDTSTKPTATSAPINIDGGVYGEGAWPPRQAFNPTISLSTDRPTIYPNDNETLAVLCSGFLAKTAYTLRYYFTSTAYDNGRRVEAFKIDFTTDTNGRFQHVLHNFDDGSLPRGVYVSTAEVDNYSSPSVARTFAAKTSSGTTPVASANIVYTCSHSSIQNKTVYTETVVISGYPANAKVSVIVYTEQLMLYPNNTIRASFVGTTDNNGSFRWERTTTDDGVTVPRGQFENWAYVAEGNLRSGRVWLSYLEGQSTSTPGTQIPKIDYSSTLSRINKGDTETQTAKLSSAPANKKFSIEWWIRSASLNGGQDFLATTTEITTNNDGLGTSVLTTTDDGTTVPRGDYECWTVCRTLNVRSTSITRSFLVNGQTIAPTTVPSLKDALVTFSTSHPTIVMGTTETIRVDLSKFAPNTTYDVDLYVRSSALNNGGAVLKTSTVQVSTNSTGSGSVSIPLLDAGVTPRGEYQSWAVVSGVTSNTVNRNFTGSTTTFDPRVTITTSTGTSQLGTREILTMLLRAAKPNTAYTYEFWTTSPALNGNQPYRAATRSMVTDANGNGDVVVEAYDDGVTVPRGTYTTYGRIAELGIQSPSIIRQFIGTPAPTAPPYNPSINFWSTHSQIYPGTTETFTITISGMLPNTYYTIQVWGQSPALWGGQASQLKTVGITTNNSGNGSASWSSYDDGVVPRGAYATWAVIQETGTSAPTFTRVFS